MTFLLAVDPVIAQDRIESRGYDHEELDFLHAAAAAYRSLPEYGDFVVIDANGTPAEVAETLRAESAERTAAPRPSRVPALVANTRAVLLAAGPLAAGATALGYQLADAL